MLCPGRLDRQVQPGLYPAGHLDERGDSPFQPSDEVVHLRTEQRVLPSLGHRPQHQGGQELPARHDGVRHRPVKPPGYLLHRLVRVTRPLQDVGQNLDILALLQEGVEVRRPVAPELYRPGG